MSVAIILGAGSRVGEAVAAKLKENGYKVALVSRSGSGKATEDTLPIKGDVTIAAEIQNAFEQAEKVLGAPPSVVVYNTAALAPTPIKGDPFSLSEAAFHKDFQIGGLGAYTAIQAAIASFRKIKSPDEPKVFIATSNLLGVSPVVPDYFSLGAQKRFLSYLIETGATSPVYAAEGIRFYLASLAKDKTELPFVEFNGPAHGPAYWELITRKEQGDWEVRFDKDGNIFD